MKVESLVCVHGGRGGGGSQAGPTAVSIPLILYSSAALVTAWRRSVLWQCHHVLPHVTIQSSKMPHTLSSLSCPPKNPEWVLQEACQVILFYIYIVVANVLILSLSTNERSRLPRVTFTNFTQINRVEAHSKWQLFFRDGKLYIRCVGSVNGDNKKCKVISAPANNTSRMHCGKTSPLRLWHLKLWPEVGLLLMTCCWWVLLGELGVPPALHTCPSRRGRG